MPSVESDMTTDVPEVLEDPVSQNIPQKASPGSMVALLEERLKLYNDAIAAAKQLNESSKVRRYSRAEKVCAL